MARQVQIALIDDIDGSEASESIVFGIGGQHYEIDLNEANAEAFREALKPYIKVARASKQFTPKEAPAIRAWAKENNVKGQRPWSSAGRCNCRLPCCDG